MARGLSDLPPEMIEAILLKLPVKSLLRFKSISKSWNSIISHPLFIRNHYHHNSERHNLFLRRSSCSYDDDSLSFVKLENGKLQTIKTIKAPLTNYPRGGDLFCFSEHGVVLITNNYHHERCALWNPCTRTTTKLLLPYGISTWCSGICYDPASDDFKVVVLYLHFYAVYSCKNKSWSNRKKHPHHVVRHPTPSGVSINGAIYWLLNSAKSSCAKIIYYDPRDDDNLKILERPKDVRDEPWTSYLLDLGGHLCVYCYYYGHGLDKIQIWIKGKCIDDNSWKELITIHKEVMPIWSLDPLCFVENKIVIQYKDCDGGDKLVVYYPLDKTFEDLGETLIGLGSLIPYRNTLFLT